MPHPPQFWLSLVGFEHVPPQLLRPVWHESWQVPFEQTWPDSHAVPRLPQLAVSVVICAICWSRWAVA